MAKGWGESFGDAFTQSFDTAQKLAYERWKQEQESQLAMQKLGYMPSNVNPEVLSKYRKVVAGGKTIPTEIMYPQLGGKQYRYSKEAALQALAPYMALSSGAGMMGMNGLELLGVNVGAGGKPTYRYGQSIGSKKAEEAIVETEGIDNMVNAVFTAGERLIPALSDPKEAELKGLQRSLGSASLFGFRPQRLMGMSDENAIAFNEIMQAEATPVIRAMGEKGMLTNQDIQRTFGLFPKNSDSIQLRQTRKKELAIFLKAKVQAYYKKLGSKSKISNSEEDFSDMSDDELKKIAGIK